MFVVKEVNARVMGIGVELVGNDGRLWKVNQLLFADDTALVADSEEGLKRIVSEFSRVCERRKLKVNVRKSKVMRCTRRDDGSRLNVCVDGERMEEVESFKYLGSHIETKGGVEVEVGYRVSEASKCLGGLKSVMSNRNLGMEAQRKLYEGVIVPTALYGAETWNIREAEKKRLNAMEMRCLRGMAGVSIMDRVRNEEVRKRTGVEKRLSDRVEQSGLRWYGHVERMNEERLVKRVWEAETKGKRPRGRPRRRWMDGVRKSLDARRLTVEQGVEKVGDREGWREIVIG